MNFADQVCKIVEMKGPLVVGMDPHLELLPPYLLGKWLRERGNNLQALAYCVMEFGELIIEAIHDVVGFVKFQMAFYELLGVPGLMVLKNLVDRAKEKGLTVILDGKRNDIASTAACYARAYLSGIEYPLERSIPSFWDVDALTVNPYFGEDGLTPFFEEAKKVNKGLFVVCRTTNPSAPFLQDEGREEKVYFKVARLVERMGEEMIGDSGFSSAGIVVGATYPEDLKMLRAEFPSLLFLIPGVGAQGGGLEPLRFAFRDDGMGALVNVSRGVLFAYRESGSPDGRGFERLARTKSIDYQERLRELQR